MNKQLFYRASIIEKLMDISSFALVKKQGTWIGALAYFKLMTYEWNSITFVSLEIQFLRENSRLISMSIRYTEAK